MDVGNKDGEILPRLLPFWDRGDEFRDTDENQVFSQGNKVTCACIAGMYSFRTLKDKRDNVSIGTKTKYLTHFIFESLSADYITGCATDRYEQ